MAFHSVEYAVFLGIFFALWWSLRGHRLVRTTLLVLASAWFYTRFDYGPTHRGLGWIYLGLLCTSAVLDFLLARAIADVDGDPRARQSATWGQRRRKSLLLVSLVYNLGVLGWFKYTNFAVDNLSALVGHLGVHWAPGHVAAVLPIGISFFTFETMSFTIDVYRRELTPPRGRGAFLEYLGFVSFFPHLVAGPIIRPRDMLPQLRRVPVFDDARASEGLLLIGLGIAKKVLVADYLALNHVDRVFDRPEWFSGLESLAAIYGYALQIYCDFSGYTDIAIGSGLLLGIVLPANFRRPYQAKDLQDFWHRWHISLSSWLRDYLYIPLGGSRHGGVATYRNLLITMLLGGLWHGAAWTFVMWGALHGVALAVTRLWQRHHTTPPSSRGGGLALVRSVLSSVLTFHYVCLAWVFFRADSFGRALAVLRQVVTGGLRLTNLSPWVAMVLVVGYLLHLLPERIFSGFRQLFVASPAVLQGALLFLLALVLRQVASTQVVPFVYFQF